MEITKTTIKRMPSRWLSSLPRSTFSAPVDLLCPGRPSLPRSTFSAPVDKARCRVPGCGCVWLRVCPAGAAVSPRPDRPGAGCFAPASWARLRDGQRARGALPPKWLLSGPLCTDLFRHLGGKAPLCKGRRSAGTALRQATTANSSPDPRLIRRRETVAGSSPPGTSRAGESPGQPASSGRHRQADQGRPRRPPAGPALDGGR
jgi:hypothetical protein